MPIRQFGVVESNFCHVTVNSRIVFCNRLLYKLEQTLNFTVIIIFSDLDNKNLIKSMNFSQIIKIMFLFVAVEGLYRIEHVLQAAFTSLELQSARCPLNFDILTLKKSCSICDQMHGTIHFQPLKIKAACSTLIRYRCCEPIKMLRWRINQTTSFEKV